MSIFLKLKLYKEKEMADLLIVPEIAIER